MPLALNEIKARAAAFANEFKDATNEESQAQEFENEFFNIFGLTRRKVATFEQKATLHQCIFLFAKFRHLNLLITILRFQFLTPI